MPAGSGPAPGAPPPLDSGVCSISPSDLVGNVGNALNRIKELEQRVAELEAQNVEANQLSDLAQQVGWVDGVTYMGIPGWTQTEYGSLIPPPGVTLSSLGIIPPTIPGAAGQQFVIYDADGNLVFGADMLGELFGSSVDAWNAATEQDYARYTYLNVAGSTTNSESRGCTITSTDTTGGAGHIHIQVARAGLYRVSSFLVHDVVGTLFSTVTNSILLQVWNLSDGSQAMVSHADDGQREIIADITLNASVSGEMYLEAGETVAALFTLASTGATSATLEAFSLSVARISA